MAINGRYKLLIVNKNDQLVESFDINVTGLNSQHTKLDLCNEILKATSDFVKDQEGNQKEAQ